MTVAVQANHFADGIDAFPLTPLNLTRRGVWSVAVVAALLAGAILVFAWISAPPSVDAVPTSGTAVITVQSGDTLWGIASRVAPGVSPANEVANLQQLNHLTDATILVGQQLRVR